MCPTRGRQFRVVSSRLRLARSTPCTRTRATTSEAIAAPRDRTVAGTRSRAAAVAGKKSSSTFRPLPGALSTSISRTRTRMTGARKTSGSWSTVFALRAIRPRASSSKLHCGTPRPPEDHTPSNNFARVRTDAVQIGAAIRTPQTVYLGFGLESISSAEGRATVMRSRLTPV